MREIIIGKGIKTGVRLDEYIMSVFPACPKNAVYKAFRKKDVKINGKWAAPDAAPSPFDVINIYLPDELLFGKTPVVQKTAEENLEGTVDKAAGGVAGAAGAIVHGAGFTIVYEDSRLLIVNKSQGLPVHPDRGGRGVTLIELVHEYLRTKANREAIPDARRRAEIPQTGFHDRPDYLSATDADNFTPAMCHRLDRNTGGLVAIAKDKSTLQLMLKHFATGAIKKEYRCIVLGKPDPPEATLRAYLTKNSTHGKVDIYPRRGDAPDYAREIITRYRTLDYDPNSDTSKLEVALLTGRTHQIRAHLAAIGHPVIGDGKYCPNAINKRFYARYQMLVANRLKFPDMPGFAISGKTIEIPDGLTHPIP